MPGVGAGPPQEGHNEHHYLRAEAAPRDGDLEDGEQGDDHEKQRRRLTQPVVVEQPRKSFEHTVQIGPRQVLLITYDAERRELVTR